MSHKRRTTVSLEGWYFLVVMGFVFAGAMLREINLLMVLFGLMLGTFLFSWRTVRRMTGGLEVRRRAPQVVRAGETLTVDIEVRTTRRRGWALAIEDTARLEAPRIGAAPLSIGLFFPQVPAGETRRQSFQGRLMQRGRYRFGPLRCTTQFPLGLVRRTLIVDDPAEVTVYPRLGRLTAAWNRQRHEAVAGSQQMQRPVGLREGDYHGLRDWRPGDSRRWIHWRTTARRGELMVRQFEQHRNHDLVLLLELWQPSRPTPAEREWVEQVIRFAATLLADRCTTGGGKLALGLAAAAPAALNGPASQALFRDAMQRLSEAEAIVGESPTADALPKLLDEALGQAQGGAEVVLVSTRRVDTADTERFARIWSDKQKRNWMGRIQNLTAADDGLREWYEDSDED